MIRSSIVISIFTLALFGCAKVAVTGREQLSLVSNSEIVPMAEKEYDSLIHVSKLSNNAEWTSMVKSVGSRIEKAVEKYMADHNASSELQGFKWEFNVIDDPKTVNAWCMPGGKVAFYTGIMPICQNEAGVATVMGHEVAHAIANHGRERMSQGMIANGLLGTLGAALGQNPTMTKQIFYQAVGIGAQVGMLKFSRTQESEADHIGLIFMAMAGYDPHDAIQFWQRMTALDNGGAPPEFLSDHPANATRIRDLEKELPEAMKYYKK